MDTGEILWRIRAAMSSQLDAVRIPFGSFPKLKSSDLQHIETFSPGFSCKPRSGSFAWKSEQDPFNVWSDRLCEKADLILKDKLSFFDVDSEFLGSPIDWQKDISSGKSGSLRQSIVTDYRDFDSVGDCKLVWEPNRHHQLVVLARAYEVTENKEYARKVVSLMLDWIDANPFGYGMNWKSPLEVGIRLINWVWAIDLIRDAGVFDENTWASVMSTIYTAEWDTQRKFSEGSSANNHLIGEAAGVFIATSYFNLFPNADRWRSKSKRVLEREILAQTYSDGCTREHAFAYQFFVLQFLTLSALVGEKTNESFSQHFMDRLHRMYEFMADVCSDTGSQPNVGDADNGYVLDLGEMPDQQSELISIGAQLFDDDKLMSTTAPETAYWLFGERSLDQRTSATENTSRPYPESGYFILRSERISIVFDCAELGYGSIAAHGHADCLSVMLSIGNLEFLVDPGTYDYFSFPKWRQYFRETRAHNTVTVDGLCQSESLGPFLWGKRANAELLEWRNDETETTVCGKHDGYTRLSDPVIHTRTVVLDKISNLLEIRDHFDCDGPHRVTRHFHLSSECLADRVSESAVRITRSGVGLILTVGSGSVEIHKADEKSCLGWVSPGYHVRRPSHCVVIEDEIDGPTDLITKCSI